MVTSEARSQNTALVFCSLGSRALEEGTCHTNSSVERTLARSHVSEGAISEVAPPVSVKP